MRCIVCRVTDAAVHADGVEHGRIGRGLLVYVGLLRGDDASAVDWMADRLPALRVFEDERGKMNRSAEDLGAGLLLIPNFTLAGRTRKGTRPSFADAAPPEEAEELFARLVERSGARVAVASGAFGAPMEIHATFDGPVTLVVDRAAES